ncbi:MAG TPA: hypothetical protein VFM98_03450 [Ramlibacter sp.]|uniref:hypothetical protein n=1 Tax=Ramlibacter sp. TaxID=1917967 RepID=UPI002D80B54C|nr:hypothetical protein [Ramlibacter sp.]HET8744635.1 hypothetical protein [Ramlibacter sp.]
MSQINPYVSLDALRTRDGILLSAHDGCVWSWMTTVKPETATAFAHLILAVAQQATKEAPRDA